MPRGRSRGRRTDYSWGGLGDVDTGIDPGAAARFGGQASTFGSASTVMRVRGMVGATLNAAAVNEFMLVLFGIGIFQADQVASGIVPEFTTDGSTVESGHWLWTGAIYLSSGLEGTVVTDKLSGDLVIDSKAMRRVKANDVIAMAFEIPAALAQDQGGTVDIAWRFRTLIGQ